MSKEFSRNRRIAEQMRRNLSEIVRRELKDPRLQFLTITRVDLSGDLSHAKVFVTVFETDKAEASIKALNRAAGYLRRRLGQEMRIRSVPELHFQHDASVETGQRMDSLINAAVASDRDESEDLERDEEE